MKLLVIEGLDGAGKSTQIGLLKEYLENQKQDCRFLHFPRTEAPYWGELISRFLRGEFGEAADVDPYLVAMLYAGDRQDASVTIREWLDDGKIVILDRYTYSNIAYQCAKLDTKEKQEKLRNWILDLEFRHFGIPVPTLNIFLDVPFRFTEKKLMSKRTGTDRHYLNGNTDIHESSLDFQKRVRDIYFDIAATDPLLEIVNCSGEGDNILQPNDIFTIIHAQLTKRGVL